MIELFDAERLVARRDHSLTLAAVVLALGAGTLAVWATTLQQKLRAAEAQRVALQTQLKSPAVRSGPSAALVADMQRQAEAMEGHLRLAGSHETAAADALRPSSWLDRLAALSSAEVSLAKVELERNGAARIEGLATSPAAMSAFVQAFAARQQPATPHPRAIEVRQEKTQAPYLRFVMRAQPPLPAAPSSTPPAATAVEAAASAAASPLQVATTGTR